MYAESVHSTKVHDRVDSTVHHNAKSVQEYVDEQTSSALKPLDGIVIFVGEEVTIEEPAGHVEHDVDTCGDKDGDGCVSGPFGSTCIHA